MDWIFDLLVIGFLLLSAFFCLSWGAERWGLVARRWYWHRWERVLMRTLAVLAVLIGLYNLWCGLSKIWYTIEGYLA